MKLEEKIQAKEVEKTTLQAKSKVSLTSSSVMDENSFIGLTSSIMCWCLF